MSRVALVGGRPRSDLKTLVQDGTKVKAIARRNSFHRRAILEKRLKRPAKHGPASSKTLDSGYSN
jgi:hypothetical protein